MGRVPKREDPTTAKGEKCPNCGEYKLQPYTTNQRRCSNCGTIVPK
jgi:uncharacterized protein (DUF983 family)